MFSLPPDRLYHPSITDATPQSILVSYALIGLIPLVLRGISSPIAGTILLAVLLSIGLGVRRVTQLVRCLENCGGFAFDLGGRVHVTVTQQAVMTYVRLRMPFEISLPGSLLRSFRFPAPPVTR